MRELSQVTLDPTVQETPAARERECPAVGEEPGQGPTETYATLAGALRDRRVEVRKAAVRVLGWNRAGVPLLCEAVHDRSMSVSLAAVRALGGLNDPRAIPALRWALRRCFGGGRRWLHPLVTGGWFAAVMVVLAWCVLLPPETLVPAGVMFVLCFSAAGFAWESWRQGRSEYFAAVNQALRNLAASQPTPDLRLALADLRTLARSPTVLDPEARARSRELSERIDELTRDLRDLPAPARGAAAPTEANVSLPRPLQRPPAGSTADTTLAQRHPGAEEA